MPLQTTVQFSTNVMKIMGHHILQRYHWRIIGWRYHSGKFSGKGRYYLSCGEELSCCLWREILVGGRIRVKEMVWKRTDLLFPSWRRQIQS